MIVETLYRTEEAGEYEPDKTAQEQKVKEGIDSFNNCTLPSLPKHSKYKPKHGVRVETSNTIMEPVPGSQGLQADTEYSSIQRGTNTTIPQAEMYKPVIQNQWYTQQNLKLEHFLFIMKFMEKFLVDNFETLVQTLEELHSRWPYQLQLEITNREQRVLHKLELQYSLVYIGTKRDQI